MNRSNFYLAIFAFSLLSLPAISLAQSADDEQISVLKKQVDILRKRIELLEKEQVAKSQAKNVNRQLITESMITKQNPPTQTSKIYATIRPTWGYIDEHNSKKTDVRDALSHLGFKLTSEFKAGWQAEMQGEWGIDLANNGDFGKTRRAYVALDSPYGRVGIGKQRPPQYLLIAEYIDIFNHASSPFAYDPQSLFFVNNLITYKQTFKNFTWLAAAQFNGDDGDNYNDLFNVGISYDFEGFHGAITYLSQDQALDSEKTGKDDVIAAALAYSFSNSLYLAVGYQDRQYHNDLTNNKTNGHTFDISTSYKLSKQIRLKLGYFDYADGKRNSISNDLTGTNVTLEWLPAQHLRFHLEYLQKDFAFLPDFASWTIGFRYDFSKNWRH